MSFTTQRLAARMAHPHLAGWSKIDPDYQAPYVAAFASYFNEIQTWIYQNGGTGLFGWDNIAGLTHANHTPVAALTHCGYKSAFNDAFNHVREHLQMSDFRLYQAAQASQRLIRVLDLIG